ncbi:hypothetical protein C0580_03740 [Candidatus Parcubacteria bacterium]|nr:MAG: hypothetical protein C0580_03740 [Candidatus Parcubacteria bacterium]
MKKIKAFLLPLIIYTLLFSPFSVSAEEVRDIVFPIQEGWGYNFSDTYGAARSGGRSHEGTDIMVDQMTPLVAAVDGRVTYLVDEDKGWGLALYIEDEDGYSYRYLHINNDTPGTDDGKEIRAYAFPKNIVRGTRVTAGQVVAFAGDSGNAEYTAHHLHFEMWTPDRESINSYPSLMAAIGQPVATENTDGDDLKADYHFMRDLELGNEGDDVRALQEYLNQNGFYVSSSGVGSPGNESDYFGPATQEALARFQRANDISPAAGFFGVITRTFVNEAGIIASDDDDETIKTGWLIKEKSSPRVYYVAPNRELMWVVNEDSALRNFGEDWNKDIKEFDDLKELELPFGDYMV